MRVLCLVVGLTLAVWPTLAAAKGASTQTLSTDGSCSPIITQTAGNVSIVCEGISARALDELAGVIKQANLATEAAQAKADQWAERYFELSRTIETLQVGLSDAVVAVARSSLEQGQLDEASGAVKVLQAALDAQLARSRDSLRQFMQAMIDRGEQPGGIISITKLWPRDRPVTFCFFGGDATTREYVVRHGLEWTLHGGITFDFGAPPAYRSCSNDFASAVRIKLDDRSFWSYIGRDALLVPQSRATVGLALTPLKSSASLDYHVLHEFGHVLGLYHIYRHASGCADAFDWDYISEVLPGGPAALEQMRRIVLGPQRQDGHVYGEYDAQSVMQFEYPARYYFGGETNRCYSGKITRLSIRDKLAMFRTYPID